MPLALAHKSERAVLRRENEGSGPRMNLARKTPCLPAKGERADVCASTRRRRTAIAHTYLCRYFLTYRSHPDRKPVVSRFAHNKNQPLELMALAARFVRRPAQLPADAFKTVETVAARGLKPSLCVHARGDAAFLGETRDARSPGAPPTSPSTVTDYTRLASSRKQGTRNAFPQSRPGG